MDSGWQWETSLVRGCPLRGSPTSLTGLSPPRPRWLAAWEVTEPDRNSAPRPPRSALPLPQLHFVFPFTQHLCHSLETKVRLAFSLLKKCNSIFVCVCQNPRPLRNSPFSALIIYRVTALCIKWRTEQIFPCGNHVRPKVTWHKKQKAPGHSEESNCYCCC